MDDVEDSHFEIDAKIVEGIFLKLKQLVLTTSVEDFGIVRFPAFCSFQSVVHVVSERKPCTLYLENLCNLSCDKKKQNTDFIHKQYCQEYFAFKS